MISDQIQLTDTEDDTDDESACASSLSKPKESSASTSEACLNGGNYNAFFIGLTNKVVVVACKVPLDFYREQTHSDC